MPVSKQNSDHESGQTEANEAKGAHPLGSDNKTQAAVTRRQASDGHLSEGEPDDEAGMD